MNLSFLNPIRDQWNRLAPGERRLAIFGGVVLCIALFLVLFWLPLQSELARLRVSVPEEHAQLQRMRSQAASIAPLRGRSGTKPAAGTMLSVVEQSASARNIRSFISRMEAVGNNSVQLTLEVVPFNSLLSWLADIQDNHAVRIESISLDAHTAPGTVNAKLKLGTDQP